jgi:hypothetical protein
MKRTLYECGNELKANNNTFVAVPGWLWRLMSAYFRETSPQEVSTVAVRPSQSAGTDEYGRVEFGVPGFGTC